MGQMKLGDFISSTLIEIIDGIKSAQEFSKENEASVNSVNIVYNETAERYKIKPRARSEAEPSPIDFDILLTYRQDDKAKGGFGIFAAPFGAGVQGENRDYSENASRVQFQIFVQLPQQN
jgi:hypothetical protein